MADPVMELFEAGSSSTTGTIVSSALQIDFGLVPSGTTSPTITVDLWNDRAGVAGSDTADPQINAFGVAAFDEFFAGTAVNGNQSMLEARSCGATGTPGDYQTNWTPIRPDSFLELGPMPSNSKRVIELRVRVPYDAAPFSIGTPNLMVHF